MTRKTHYLLAAAAIAAVTVALLALYQPPVSTQTKTAGNTPPGLEWLNKLPATIKVHLETPQGTPIGNNTRAPQVLTCDGEGQQPVVEWTRVQGAKAYTVIIYDPDASHETFYHLIAYNINTTRLDPATKAPTLPNTAGTQGWYPICPPRGHPTHHYITIVIAQKQYIEQASSLNQLLQQLRQTAIAYGAHIMTYQR